MAYQKKLIEYGIYRADPLPTLEDLKEHYESKYYQEANGTTTYETVYSETELEHKKLEATLAIKAINDHILPYNKSASLLELGCGEGFFLKQVSEETKWCAKGIDFSKFGVSKWNPDMIDKCEFGDVDIYTSQYIAEGQLFDVCVLRNILEHVIDPKNLLSKIKKLLQKNGFILITVPNDYSPIQMAALSNGNINKDYWFMPPDHLHYFNVRNLCEFVENIGFRVVDMFSSFPVDMFLFHPGSNYFMDKGAGKAVHHARINLDLLLAKQGIEKLLNLYRAMANCEIGRDISIIVTPF